MFVKKLEMNILQTNSFTAMPRFTHLNRKNGRLLKRELEQVNKTLSPVVGNFLNELFQSHYEYNPLYNHYLRAYIERAEYLNKKCKYLVVQSDFFSQQFKPLEYI